MKKKNGCGISIPKDDLKECPGISLENQQRDFAISEDKLFVKYPPSTEWIEFGEITEQTDKLIKGRTKNGTFELKIESNKFDN